MNILYYSNYCEHSKKLLQYLAKNGLAQELNCLCIDRRTRDERTGQIYLLVEKGTKLLLPPNIHAVPALLLVNEKYRVLTGEAIYKHFEPKVDKRNNAATGYNGEPSGYVLGGGIVSEKFTNYNMTPDELSAKGYGGHRQLHDYVSATGDFQIHTPPETYKPDKIGGDVTLESLMERRNKEIPQIAAPPVGTHGIPVIPPPPSAQYGIGGQNMNMQRPQAPPTNPYIAPIPQQPQQNAPTQNAYDRTYDVAFSI